jgi:hypothetical protein
MRKLKVIKLDAAAGRYLAKPGALSWKRPRCATQSPTNDVEVIRMELFIALLVTFAVASVVQFESRA